MKPILDNTEMVRAILDGRKTVTRRVVKPCPVKKMCHVPDGTTYGYWMDAIGQPYRPTCYPGDILYVRETWRIWKAHRYDADAHIEFKAGGDGTIIKFPHGCTDSVDRDDYDSFIGKWGVGSKWRPSIHMPKEAARLFLRVTDVWMERLQECGKGWCLDIEKEGIVTPQDPILYIDDDAFHAALREEFKTLWDSTIQKADLPLYGWDANPWVWVIEFERCDNPELAGGAEHE